MSRWGACRLPVILMLIALSVAGRAQEDISLTDRIFSGSQFAIDLAMIPGFPARYEHRTGMVHHPDMYWDFSLEVGLKWRYYFNKSWSLETGIAGGNRRTIRFNADLGYPEYVATYTSDPDTQQMVVQALNDNRGLVERIGLPINISFPLLLGYHLYPGQSGKHILDFRAGTAIRYHFELPQGFYAYSFDILYLGDKYSFEDIIYFTGSWYTRRRVTADLQAYIGYTYLRKSRTAFSFGFLANVSFEKDHAAPMVMTFLKDTDFEGSGEVRMITSYFAIKLAWGFTFYRDNLLRRRDRR